MATFLEQRWMCGVCGHIMDAASNADGCAGPPADNDVTACINCGATYIRRKNKWTRMTDAERARLPRYVSKELERLEALRITGNTLSQTQCGVKQ